MEAALTVVVPVFNGFDATRRCLDALARHTPARVAVVLVDDASTDPRVAPLLAGFAASRDSTTVIANPTNVGFPGTANRGFAANAGDAIVLNSDAIVTAGWIEGLERCRDSDPAIAIACPLSNRATILSIPGIETLFATPGGEPDIDAIARCVARAGRRNYPRLPTAVGFCMLLRRRLLDEVGMFDEAFGRGYGEENDLSMRALDRGWRIACADDVYVHHESEASFGATSGLDELRARNARLLDRRWPMYSPGVRAWALANPLRAAFERIVAAGERERMPGRPRVLQVVHRFEARGGIEEHTRALVNGMKENAAFTVALPGTTAGAWTDLSEDRPVKHLRVVRFNPDLATEGIRVIGHRASVSDPGIENAFRALLSGGFDVVHLQSMVGWNTLALARIARESGARVVLSAHDMAMMCGDYNMMAPGDGAPCGRMRARGDDAGCVACLRGKSTASGVVPPIPQFIEERHAAAAAAIEATDAIVCPSRFAAERVRAAFGDEAAKRCRVIGHGVARASPLERHPTRPMLTAAFVGRFARRKGSSEVLEAARSLAGARVVIEVHGPCDDKLVPEARAAGLVLRGPYDPSELAERLRGVDVVIAPSILEETYCLVASEAQMLGIPVVASRQGAPPERIREGETGFLIPPGDARALTELLLRLRDDRPRLEAVATRLRTERPETVEANVAEYLALYRSLASEAPRADVFDAGDDEERLARAFDLPRKRIRTPLGDDRYDRWIAREEAPRAAADALPDLVRFAAAGRSDDLAAVNREIAECRTDWVALTQEGDAIASGALGAIAEAARSHPDAELIYTDDDMASTRGERYGPLFKPAFDAELLCHVPYLVGLCAVRRETLVGRGGFSAPGWLGVIDLALSLARDHLASRVVRVPMIGVQRSEANARVLEGERFAPAYERRVAEHLRRAGCVPRRLDAADDAPAMWAYAPARGARVSAAVLGADKSSVDACIASLVQRCGTRLAEIFIDLPPADAAEVIPRHARSGALPILTIGQPSLGHALLRASSPWLIVADARCYDFTGGWLERLEQGIAGEHVAAIAPYLRERGGALAPGWDVIGAGPWAIAGRGPLLDATREAALLHAPRQVGALAGRLMLVRREAAISSGALEAIEGAGPWQAAHLCLALRAAGNVVVSRPFVAATFDGYAAPPATREAVRGIEAPAAVEWMRKRWGGRLKHDPGFPAELGLDEARPLAALRFGRRKARERKRLVAFPFDRGGSGEMRVRQPVEALAAAACCELVMMPEHDAGSEPPNALAWERLDADAMYALNFFHDAQLRSLAQGAPALRVIGMDDLLTELPPWNPYSRTIYPDIADRIKRALERCDRLVVSTPPLLEAYGHLAPQARVIPNAIDLSRWPAPRTKAERKRPRVGWAGASQHLEDLRLIARVVEATAAELDWIFLGMCPPEMRAWAAEVHPMVGVGRYPARLASLDLDIAVAPLVDHPFNRAKSALKLLEYGALALPVVASDLEPYRGAPVERVRDDPDAWIAALRAIARSPDRGNARGAALRRWVEETGSLQAQLPAWMSVLGLGDEFT